MKLNVTISFTFLAALLFVFALNISAQNRIGLVYSANTKNIISPGQPSASDAWELYFMNNKIAYKIITDDDLEDNDLDDVDLLIFPNVQVLNEDQLSNIKDFLIEKKGIFILGNFGTYNDDGKMRSTSYLQSLTGFEAEEVRTDSKISLIHTLGGNSALTHNIEGGTKLLVSARPLPLAVSNPVVPVNYLGEYLLSGNFIKSDEQAVKHGAASLELRDGRIVWLGFGLEQLIGGSAEKAVFDSFLRNVFDWLGTTPIAFVNTWPKKYEAAAVFTAYIDPQYLNINEFENSLNRLAVKGNFFLSYTSAALYTKVLSSLGLLGEVNLTWDEFSFYQMTIQDKRDWLRQAIGLLKSVSGQNSFGLRVFGPIVSSENLKLIKESGFDYIFTNGTNASLLPEKNTVNGLFVLTKENREADEVFKSPRHRSNLDLAAAVYKSDYDRVKNHGGLYVLNFLNQINKIDGSYEYQFLSDLKRYLEKNGAWITTFSKVIEWLNIKRDIRISILKRDEERFSLQVSNNAAKNAQDINIVVSIPQRISGLQLETGSKDYTVAFDEAKKNFFLTIPSLRSRESLTIELYGK
jgi:hypothetical protein